jgi:hypothetical protein
MQNTINRPIVLILSPHLKNGIFIVQIFSEKTCNKRHGLLHNAVDHGIETAQQRGAAQKLPTGLITLRVVRERGRVVLILSDDGAGIDLKRVHQQAAVIGLITPDERPIPHQLLSFLLEEGFSLSETGTQTSGRGVGLDVVRRAVNRLLGTVRVWAQQVFRWMGVHRVSRKVCQLPCCTLLLAVADVMSLS